MKRSTFSYSKRPRSSRLRKRYLEWRHEHGIPLRCDERQCCFFSGPLVWNGNVLPVTLDHINGVASDDRLENLRLLCPNCHSQQDTTGHRNRGRVETSDGGFAIKRGDGKRDYFLPTEPATFVLDGKGLQPRKRRKR